MTNPPVEPRPRPAPDIGSFGEPAVQPSRAIRILRRAGWVSLGAVPAFFAGLYAGNFVQQAKQELRDAAAEVLTWHKIFNCKDAGGAAEVNELAHAVSRLRRLRITLRSPGAVKPETLVYVPNWREKTPDFHTRVKDYAQEFCKTGEKPPQP